MCSEETVIREAKDNRGSKPWQYVEPFATTATANMNTGPLQARLKQNLTLTLTNHNAY